MHQSESTRVENGTKNTGSQYRIDEPIKKIANRVRLWKEKDDSESGDSLIMAQTEARRRNYAPSQKIGGPASFQIPK